MASCKPFILIFTALLLLAVPSATAANSHTTSTYTWHMRSDTGTVNGVTGYMMNATPTASVQSVYTTTTGATYQPVYYGWRVWLAFPDGTQTELTDGTPQAQTVTTANTTDYEEKSSTWLAPSTTLYLGFNSFKMTVYLKFGSGAWAAITTYTTEPISEIALNSATWAFTINMKVARVEILPDYQTRTWLRWGSSDYADTRVEDVEFTDPNTYEKAGGYLQAGNFIAFILSPWINLLGSDVTWGLMLAIPLMSIYVRSKSTIPILVICIVFGGSAGVINLLVPMMASWLLWVFMLLSLGGLLYKIFKG